MFRVPRSATLGYSIRRAYVDEFLTRHFLALPQGSHVLDLGGHKTAKRGAFDIGRYAQCVTVVDLSRTKGPDIQADAAALPCISGLYDVIVCSELLEHVPDPRRVLHEAHRVLVEGGILLITVPFMYPVHADPYDYGRYTDHYWTQALAAAGFDVCSIERQGLFFSVLLNMLKLLALRVTNSHPINRLVRGALALLLFMPLQRLARRLESTPGVQVDPFLRAFTTGYGILAVKRKT